MKPIAKFILVLFTILMSVGIIIEFIAFHKQPSNFEVFSTLSCLIIYYNLKV